MCSINQQKQYKAKYPTGIVIKLSGPDGNIFYLMGLCNRLMQQLGLDEQERKQVLRRGRGPELRQRADGLGAVRGQGLRGRTQRPAQPERDSQQPLLRRLPGGGGRKGLRQRRGGLAGGRILRRLARQAGPDEGSAAQASRPDAGRAQRLVLRQTVRRPGGGSLILSGSLAIARVTDRGPVVIN